MCGGREDGGDGGMEGWRGSNGTLGGDGATQGRGGFMRSRV
jgi:hypothetical protein